MDSEHSIVLPIWVVGWWVGGDFYLLWCVLSVAKPNYFTDGKQWGLDISAGSGNRKFQIWKGEWQAMARNAKNRCVFPLVPTALGYAKLEEYFGEMGNCDLEVLASQADFGGNFGS